MRFLSRVFLEHKSKIIISFSNFSGVLWTLTEHLMSFRCENAVCKCLLWMGPYINWTKNWKKKDPNKKPTSFFLASKSHFISSFFFFLVSCASSRVSCRSVVRLTLNDPRRFFFSYEKFFFERAANVPQDHPAALGLFEISCDLVNNVTRLVILNLI